MHDVYNISGHMLLWMHVAKSNSFVTLIANSISAIQWANQQTPCCDSVTRLWKHHHPFWCPLSCVCELRRSLLGPLSLRPCLLLLFSSPDELLFSAWSTHLIHSNYSYWNWIEASLFTSGCACLAFWEWNQSSSQTAQGLPKATPTNLHLCFALLFPYLLRGMQMGGCRTSIMFFSHRNKVCRLKIGEDG